MGVLCLSCIFQYFYICILKVQKANLQDEIIMLQKEAQEQNIRYENAHKNAIDEAKRSQDNINGIMLANIPKNCKEAVEWGIKQAKMFS